MAIVLAGRGFRVTGVDTNPDVRQALLGGRASRSEHGLDDVLHQALQENRLTATETPLPADAYVIAVPTPLHNGDEPAADLGYVRTAARSVASVLRPGNLVVLESTVPPGTTEGVLVPELEGSGLKAGRDFLVAHVPERVLPGNVIAELTENGRVIGGIDVASGEAARKLYASFVAGEIVLTDARTAEMVKLMENTYRDVNIALANEFALLAEELGVDVRGAIDLANQHPRVNILQPGPGVGGHCIPVDPWFLASASSHGAPLIRAARAVNDAMPRRIADLLKDLLSGISAPTVALFGLAYKGETDDTRNSPALALAGILRSRGWNVRCYDPYTSHAADFGDTFSSPVDAARDTHALLVMTDHREFAKIDPETLRPVMEGSLVFDARGVLDEARWCAAGFDVRKLGARPTDRPAPTS